MLLFFKDSDKLVAMASDDKFFTTSGFEKRIFRGNLGLIRVSFKIIISVYHQIFVKKFFTLEITHLEVTILSGN